MQISNLVEMVTGFFLLKLTPICLKLMDRKMTPIKKINLLLSQKIKDIYQKKLGHKLDNVYYRLFDNTLIIMLDGTITSPEKLLKNNAHLDLAKEVRQVIDSVIQPQIQNTVEEILDVKVIDFLTDTTIDNDITGGISIFESSPRT